MARKPPSLVIKIISKRKKEATFVLILIVVGLALATSFIFGVQVKPNLRFVGLLRRLNIVSTPLPELTADPLATQVAPAQGYTVNVRWGDTGIKLVETGAIDITKFRENYSDQQLQELLGYLTNFEGGGITINKDSAYFWLNTLWALGLVQRSDVLSKGAMGKDVKELGNFASTGGWTLGAKDSTFLYNSSEIVPLTDKQQAVVNRISKGIYRPCCSNPTSFPDCNHGMAILGLVELMASQGFLEREVYEAALAFNSYWFLQTYVDLAYYFQTEENISWGNVDPRRVLSAKFSSAPGYEAIKKQIKGLQSSSGSSGSCSA